MFSNAGACLSATRATAAATAVINSDVELEELPPLDDGDIYGPGPQLEVSMHDHHQLAWDSEDEEEQQTTETTSPVPLIAPQDPDNGSADN